MGDSTNASNLITVCHELLVTQRDAEAAHQRSDDALRRGRTRVVRLARLYGIEWEIIGNLLGITAEAARKAYERGF